MTSPTIISVATFHYVCPRCGQKHTITEHSAAAMPPSHVYCPRHGIHCPGRRSARLKLVGVMRMTAFSAEISDAKR
jgi:hypothetical protein